MSRSDQLKTVAEEFCSIHDLWSADKKRPSPDGEYWEAVDNLTAAFASGDMPEDCRELSDAVQVFAREVQEFDDRDNPDDNPDPGNAFWSAREKIATVLAGKGPSARLRPLESIASLRALPGMTDLQIAKIWGFKDRHGNWLPHLVQEELDRPGSVLKTPGAIDGRDWRDPRLSPSGNAPAERIATKVSEKRKKEARKTEPCPETPKQLWEQKVSVSQSAKMLQRDEAEVATLFAQFDQEMEDALASGEILSPQTQQIRELAAQKLTPKSISQRLSVSLKDVKQALQGWEPAAEAAGEAA